MVIQEGDFRIIPIISYGFYTGFIFVKCYTTESEIILDPSDIPDCLLSTIIQAFPPLSNDIQLSLDNENSLMEA